MEKYPLIHYRVENRILIGVISEEDRSSHGDSTCCVEMSPSEEMQKYIPLNSVMTPNIIEWYGHVTREGYLHNGTDM